MNRTLLAAGLIALLTGPAAAELERTSYLDWSIFCKDDNYCIARTSGSGPDGEAFRMKVERGAKPGSTVYVSFGPETELKVGLRTRIEISGADANYGTFGEVDKVYSANEMAFAGPSDRELIDKLRFGDRANIQIEFGGAAGTRTYQVTLKGLTQALLKMDEEQGRIGRRDALVARGGVAADAGDQITTAMGVPATSGTKTTKAPPAPEPEADSAAAAEDTPARDPAAAAAAESEPEPEFNGWAGGEWGQTYEEQEVPDPIQRFAGRALGCELYDTVPAYGANYYVVGDVATWIVPCEMADTNVSLFMMTDVSFDPSLGVIYEFKNPQNDIREDSALVFNLDFDPERATVSGTTYYGPNWDCGMHERYKFNAGLGEFELVEILEKQNCDGQTTSPSEWPRL